MDKNEVSYFSEDQIKGFFDKEIIKVDPSFEKFVKKMEEKKPYFFHDSVYEDMFNKLNDNKSFNFFSSNEKSIALLMNEYIKETFNESYLIVNTLTQKDLKEFGPYMIDIKDRLDELASAPRGAQVMLIVENMIDMPPKIQQLLVELNNEQKNPGSYSNFKLISSDNHNSPNHFSEEYLAQSVNIGVEIGLTTKMKLQREENKKPNNDNNNQMKF